MKIHDIIYSIIIPHYNIPELLVRCLNSIPIRQDIQVIVVDDCSPNVNSYFEKYPDFKRPYLEWYNTPKGGSAGRARNIGLDHARGKWVICIDADDLFVDNMEKILDEMTNRKEDIVFYNYHSVYSNNLKREGTRVFLQDYFRKFKEDHDESNFRYVFDPIWCKIIRRELIEKHHIRCDETKYGNDASFSQKIGYYANKIAIFDKPLFIITQREGSLASSFFIKKEISHEENTDRMKAILKCQNFLDSKGIKIELPHFVTLKKHLILQKETFFIILIKTLFKYPYSCMRLFSYWGRWKIRAVKTKLLPNR